MSDQPQTPVTPDAQPAVATSAKPHVPVAAGMIVRPDGKVLLGQRPEGKPWAGWWELPGGKLEPGETPLQALARELHEELGITVKQARPWVQYVHEYEKNIVHLNFCIVTGWEGTPRGMENQQLDWVDPAQVPCPVSPLLPAALPPLHWLSLPDRYLLTSIGDATRLPGFLRQLERTLQSGGRWLVQFREPAWQLRYTQSSRRLGADTDATGKPPVFDEYADLRHAFLEVLACCHRHGARCLINSIHPEIWWPEADGVHLRAEDAYYLKRKGAARPQGLLGVSTHRAEEIAVARTLQADFAVLGHVLDTPSHPQPPGMGWDAFTRQIHEAGLPIYALGGQSLDTLDTAQQHGAHGIAGIRQLLLDA